MQKKDIPSGSRGRLPYLARHVADRLLDRVKRRHRPGDRLAGQVQLARQFGVSVSTMWRALGDLAARGWIHRSRRSGTFVGEGPRGIGGTIGLLTGLPMEAFAGSAFQRDFFVGLSMATMLAEKRLLLLPVKEPGGRALFAEAVARADLAALDALVVFDMYDTAPLEPIAANIPIVVTEFVEDGGPISGVCFDHPAGVRAALEHLAALGHRRIGYVGHSYISDHPEFRGTRYEAFGRIAHQMGLELPLEWSMDARRFGDVAVALDRFMAMPADSRPTAILTRDMAWPLLYEMTRRGLVAGRDLSVVSLSYTQPWADWLKRSRRLRDHVPWAFPEAAELDELTGAGRRLGGLVPAAVTIDPQALGRAAVAEIERRWADPRLPPRTQQIPVGLRTGNTTGPSP